MDVTLQSSSLLGSTAPPRFRRTLASLAAALALAGTVDARAAELRVLTGPEMGPVIAALVPRLEELTDRTVVIDTAEPGYIPGKVDEGEAFDVAVVDEATAATLVKLGKISPDRLWCVAWDQLALGVRSGATKPDVSTDDALRQTLLSAKSIAFSGDQISGARFRDLLAQLDIAVQTEPKLIDTGNRDPLESVAEGRAEIGVSFGAKLAATPGIEALERLPWSFQSFTAIVAAVATDTTAHGPANRLVDYLSSFDAIRAIHRYGMDAALNE